MTPSLAKRKNHHRKEKIMPVYKPKKKIMVGKPAKRNAPKIMVGKPYKPEKAPKKKPVKKAK